MTHGRYKMAQCWQEWRLDKHPVYAADVHSEREDDTASHAAHRLAAEYFSEVSDVDPVDGEQKVQEPAGGVPQGVAEGQSVFKSKVFSKIKVLQNNKLRNTSSRVESPDRGHVQFITTLHSLQASVRGWKSASSSYMYAVDKP